MKGTIVVEKSFDNTNEFSKTLEDGDFEDFFQKEGEYLDRLVKIAEEHGKEGDKFVITYTVTAEM